MEAHSILDDFLIGDALADGRLLFDVGEILYCAPDQVFGERALVARAAVFTPDEAGGDVVEAHEF